MTTFYAWAPVVLLTTGAIFTVGVDTQQVMRLRAPLETSVPAQLNGLASTDVEVSKAEQRVAGMSDYLMRYYTQPDADYRKGAYEYSIYVGYYETQRQGNTIHSPKNCLPGAGWEALASSTIQVPTANGAVDVNRYLLKRKDEAALVLYWYQGRGRIEASEYAVKWQLLRDAALRGRSDEALVRVIVPLTRGEAEAQALALRVAEDLIPAVDVALPEGV